MSDSQRSRPAGTNHEAAKSLAGDYPDSTTNPRAASVPRGHVHGIDGKVYPRPLSKTDRLGLIAHVHDLHHQHRLSIRQIVGALEVQHGLRRSVGSISAYLSDYICHDCSGGPGGTPEHLVSRGVA